MKLIKFYADWCGPCHIMKPVAEKIATENDLELVEVNIDKEQEIAEQYGVRSIPTLVLVKNNQEVRRYVGANTQANVEAELLRPV